MSKHSNLPALNLERELREVQKTFPMEVEDRHDLRQPYRFAEERKVGDYTFETYTTYGAYDDPL